MPRLIETQDLDDLAPTIRLRVGDVLRLWATGARPFPEDTVVEVLGSFVESVIGTNGEVLSPEAMPNAVVLIARRPGRCTVEIAAGDPWSAPRKIIREFIVEA